MRVVENSPDRLVIEDNPVLLGAFLAILILFFAAVALWTIGSAPLVAFAALTGAALMGVAFAAFVRRVFVAFDRAAGAVVIRTASIRRQTEVQLPLTDIAQAVVEVTTSLDDQNSSTPRTLMYRPALSLKDGRPNHPLVQVYSGGTGAARVVDAINDWLRLTPPTA
jgi:hypothetical protein